MTNQLDPHSSSDEGGRPSDDPLLVEDVLLLLFQPDSGSIAGENILFYVLGAAVLGDLALAERLEVPKEFTLQHRSREQGRRPGGRASSPRP